MSRRKQSSLAAGKSAATAVLALLFALLVPRVASAQVAVELYMFEEAGCPWCARWHREVGSAYARSEEGRRAPLRRVHIAEAPRTGVRLATAVTVTPTFVLVDRGNEVGRITGYPGADFFWGLLGELMVRLPTPPGGEGRAAGVVLPSASFAELLQPAFPGRILPHAAALLRHEPR